METLALKQLFGGIYDGKKVVVTGHTGFKGSWLSFWLSQMGAEVFGISLEAETQPNHIGLLDFEHHTIIQDITDRQGLIQKITEIGPEIVFHLAAQALVRRSYDQPSETFLTNVIGTAHVLDACRQCPSIKAAVIITTDKCYENKEWYWAYREIDRLGGKDPYSASKACAEILVSAYRDSFFHLDKETNTNQTLIASARAGNVVGGGDWADDRIIPDLIRASVSGEPLKIRFPNATRPWQHVLEPLSGYLMLGWKLLEGKADFGEPWNFGPEAESNVAVIELVKAAVKQWPAVSYILDTQKQPHEAGRLMLDSAKAKNILHWDNVWDFQATINHTINWYRNYYETGQVSTLSDLMDYIHDAYSKSLIWAST